MQKKTTIRALCAAVTIGCALTGAPRAGAFTQGEIGPSLNMTANGRLLHPAGRLTTLGPAYHRVTSVMRGRMLRFGANLNP